MVVMMSFITSQRNKNPKGSTKSEKCPFHTVSSEAGRWALYSMYRQKKHFIQNLIPILLTKQQHGEIFASALHICCPAEDIMGLKSLKIPQLTHLREHAERHMNTFWFIKEKQNVCIIIAYKNRFLSRASSIDSQNLHIISLKQRLLKPVMWACERLTFAWPVQKQLQGSTCELAWMNEVSFIVHLSNTTVLQHMNSSKSQSRAKNY